MGKDSTSNCNDLLERSLVLKAVDDEPEYLGRMPDELRTILSEALKKQDVGALAEALRIIVRLTKDGIYDRIYKL